MLFRSVIAIIGVLAALAIYGVRRYLASSKTSEAKNTIGAISRGAKAAFERETAASELVAEGSTSTNASHALCDSAAAAVPGAVPGGTKYQPLTANDKDFNTGTSTAGWKCLKFSMTDPIYYQYNYTKGPGVGTAAGAPDPGTNGFEAVAQGDLNENTVVSTFARTGKVNTTTNELIVATQVFIRDEFE